MCGKVGSGSPRAEKIRLRLPCIPVEVVSITKSGAVSRKKYVFHTPPSGGGSSMQAQPAASQSQSISPPAVVSKPQL